MESREQPRANGCHRDLGLTSCAATKTAVSNRLAHEEEQVDAGQPPLRLHQRGAAQLLQVCERERLKGGGEQRLAVKRSEMSDVGTA